MELHDNIDATVQSSEQIPRAGRIAAKAARWTARVLAILITAMWACAILAGYLNGTTRAIPGAGGFAACLAIAVIAWRREDAGGMLVVAGASCGMAVTFSCNDPFSGYETTLACFMMACVVVLGALFLVSWALRATSPLPPSGQRIHCGSGSTARWQWVARATSLVALVYAMWILVMASLHRGTYGNPTYFFLCVFLCLSIIGCITGRQHPRIGGALPILAGVGLCVTLSRSDLLSWSGDRSLLFAALAVPLAVAGFFQLAAGAQRPPADVAGTSCKVRTH